MHLAHRRWRRGDHNPRAEVVASVRRRGTTPLCWCTAVTGASSTTASPKSAAIASGSVELPPATRMVSDSASGTPATAATCCSTNSNDRSGELGVVERRVRLTHHEARLRDQPEPVDPLREALPVERGGAVGSLRVLGIHPEGLGQPCELVAESPVVGEHRTSASCHEVRERRRTPVVVVAPRHPPVGRAPRSLFGRYRVAAQQPPQLGVALVDRLTTGLGPYTPRQRDALFAAAERVHASTHPRPRFEHDHVPTRVAHTERRTEARQSGADHDDPARGPGVGAGGDLDVCHAAA